METSLSRGDNIVEGHYAERLWGALLATPLQEFQIEALRQFSTGGVHKNSRGVFGALLREEEEDVDYEYYDDEE